MWFHNVLNHPNWPRNPLRPLRRCLVHDGMSLDDFDRIFQQVSFLAWVAIVIINRTRCFVHSTAQSATAQSEHQTVQRLLWRCDYHWKVWLREDRTLNLRTKYTKKNKNQWPTNNQSTNQSTLTPLRISGRLGVPDRWLMLFSLMWWWSINCSEVEKRMGSSMKSNSSRRWWQRRLKKAPAFGYDDPCFCERGGRTERPRRLIGLKDNPLFVNASAGRSVGECHTWGLCQGFLKQLGVNVEADHRLKFSTSFVQPSTYVMEIFIFQMLPTTHHSIQKDIYLFAEEDEVP